MKLLIFLITLNSIQTYTFTKQNTKTENHIVGKAEKWTKKCLSSFKSYSLSIIQEVPGSIPDHACRPSHSEFYLVFSETHVNMD